MDASNRPALDALRVSPERHVHILDGDADGGGGHRHGVGNPGKTEFPASWNDEKIINALLDVARQPDHSPGHQEWNDRWVARGTRDDVEVVAVVARDAEYLDWLADSGGPGVVKQSKGAVMDKYEIARKASSLPQRFADRITATHLGDH